jgi:hypothetical protein
VLSLKPRLKAGLKTRLYIVFTAPKNKKASSPGGLKRLGLAELWSKY